MIFEKLKEYHIILASASPRRKQLLKAMGVEFEVRPKPVDEHFPEGLTPDAVAEYLSRKKADAFVDEINEGMLLITADTVVSLEGKILGKPSGNAEAVAILQQLSGKTHEVVTGVTLKTIHKQTTFSVNTDVTFKMLSQEEIDYYVNTYKPFDKAGAYGIQEWIGHVAIERIDGSYFNVMGLPTHRLYEELSIFCG